MSASALGRKNLKPALAVGRAIGGLRLLCLSEPCWLRLFRPVPLEQKLLYSRLSERCVLNSTTTASSTASPPACVSSCNIGPVGPDTINNNKAGRLHAGRRETHRRSFFNSSTQASQSLRWQKSMPQALERIVKKPLKTLGFPVPSFQTASSLEVRVSGPVAGAPPRSALALHRALPP